MAKRKKNTKKKSKGYTLTKGICVSAKSFDEFRTVEEMILKEAPDLTVIPFENILKEPKLLDKCDFILTVGGDGSVAWLVGTFYKLFESVDNLKPIIPTIRPESVGYLKQLSLDPEEEFLRRLSLAKSNIPEMENGRMIYNRYVKPAMKSPR